MTEPEPHPLGLPGKGSSPTFMPSAADAARAVSRGRHRRTTRGLMAALAALAMPLAVVAATPDSGNNDSLRVAQTPTAAPIEATPTPDAPPAATAAATAAAASLQPVPQQTPRQSVGEQQAGAQPQPQSGQQGAAEETDGPTPTSGPGQEPHSKTGIDDQAKTVTIFLQVPPTTALRESSAASGASKYWEPGSKPRTVKGYRVLVKAFDASGSESGQACEQRAKEGFLIVGASGPQEAQACAGSANLVRDNVPYVAPGSVEAGLGGLTNYFATSLTYRGQAQRLITMADKGDYLKTSNGKGWALVLADTPAATEAEPAVIAALENAGQKVTVIRVPRTGADSTAVAAQLRAGQYASVYFHGPPLFFIELTGRVGCPGYCPQWTGVGVSTNDIGVQACNVTGRAYKGEFLSPYPGLDLAPSKAPGVTFQDDIELSTYGSMQLLDQMLQNLPGPSFTRESFLDAVSGSSFAGGVYPQASFATSRFGGTRAYALRMDCTKRQHVTRGLH